jgi:RsiW-degrading membrane proteinase PrsW (M82 family)
MRTAGFNPSAPIFLSCQKVPAMTRTNIVYLVLGALIVAVAVLGYQLYQERRQPEGVQIKIGPGGVSIEKK